MENSGDGALELIHRIERVIVHPERLEIVTGFVGAVWLGIKATLGNDPPMCRMLTMTKKSSLYRIREVDGNDDDILEALAELHQQTFLDAVPVPDFNQGNWWMALYGSEPVAFAGIVPSSHVLNAGMFAALACGESISETGFRCA